jgi:hypothetical protein
MTTMTRLHARVFALLARKGQRATFARELAGDYDPLTDTFSGASSNYVTGRAMRVTGDPTRYQALELVPSEAPTLIFAPDTVGALPSPGASIAFGGVVYTVRDVVPVAPDGVALFAQIIVTGGGRDLSAGADMAGVVGDSEWIL